MRTIMAVKKDYYKVLGVSPVASPDEIRKAYRMMSKKYHPDLNPHLRTIAEDKMKKLVEAYNILNNPTKRKEYDNQPQFQIRRFQKSRQVKIGKGGKAEDKYKKEPSLLERLLSPFFKKKGPEGAENVIDEKEADMHYTLAISMAEQESFYEQAKAEFAKAVKFNPEFVEAYYNLGLMHYKLGEFEEARIDFQKVLQYNKDDPMARRMIQLLSDDDTGF